MRWVWVGGMGGAWGGAGKGIAEGLGGIWGEAWVGVMGGRGRGHGEGGPCRAFGKGRLGGWLVGGPRAGQGRCPRWRKEGGRSGAVGCGKWEGCDRAKAAAHGGARGRGRGSKAYRAVWGGAEQEMGPGLGALGGAMGEARRTALKRR